MKEPGILIVDDVADIVAEMITMFALVGVPALGADSVPTALRVLRLEPLIRAVICDLHLQHEDGRTLLAHLQKDPDLACRSLNVIFITGDGEVESESAQAPPVTIVRKPIDPDMVIEHVRRCLDMHSG
jgi:DNA-binding NtrC family response regulator